MFLDQFIIEAFMICSPIIIFNFRDDLLYIFWTVYGRFRKPLRQDIQHIPQYIDHVIESM